VRTVEKTLLSDLSEHLRPHLRFPLVFRKYPSGRFDHPHVLIGPLELEHMQQAFILRPADRLLVSVVGGKDQDSPFPNRR